MTFPLAVRRSSCHHPMLVGGRMMTEGGWLAVAVPPMFGLPYGSDSLPTELPGLVTPPHLNSDEVAACRNCWQPMVWDHGDVWDHEFGWKIWGPLEPLDGQRRGVPKMAVRGTPRTHNIVMDEGETTKQYVDAMVDLGKAADQASTAWVQLYEEFKKLQGALPLKREPMKKENP